MVTCKASVRFKRFPPALLTILTALSWMDLYKLDGQPADLVVTSANDSTHLPTSKHYSDEALDVRAKTFRDESTKQAFRQALGVRLGSGFTVLYEDPGLPTQHFHVQVRKGR